MAWFNGMEISECEFAQRIGNTVKLRLKDPDGVFRNHYHRYKSESKAKLMLVIYGQAVAQRGGWWVKDNN